MQAVQRGQRLSLVEKRGLADLYEAHLLGDRRDVLIGRFQELPREAQQLLLSNPAQLPPPFAELTESELQLALETGLATTTDWLIDAPFYDSLRRNRPRMLPRARKP